MLEFLRGIRGMAFLLILIFGGQAVRSQKIADSTPSNYSSSALFDPLFYTESGNEIHAADGSPGAKYWQNRVDYRIQARLDTLLNRLSCEESVTYINNSPDSLSYVWLQLDQQTYRSDARSNFNTAITPAEHTSGYELKCVQLLVNGKKLTAEYLITDTRMQIRLPKTLAPHGGRLNFFIQYAYQIPGIFGGRTDWFATRNGKIYEIAQWFPRLCVYDAARGWNTLPFLGSGEFYLEYGDIDYQVTLPPNMIVAGSGNLQNPEQVYTPGQQQRMGRARASNETVLIRTPEEVTGPASRAARNGDKVWHFKMINTRDVAFAASAAYILDAAKVNLPDGRPCIAMSVYPVESAGNKAWGRATEYLKKTIEYFSKKWYPYPYPAAVNVAGQTGGMEYPGAVFDGMDDTTAVLYWVTAHEIGHNWFPMIVGSDERRFGWMDEGFNTFIDIYASEDFNKGEFAPKRDGEYAPGGGNPADEILPTLRDPDAPVIMTRADGIPEKFRHQVTYFKPALGLVLLREQILGPDRFDYAFQQYIRHWAYKHPQPDDFFRTMENAAGEDLSWFWRGWFYHHWLLDLAVTQLKYTGNDPGKGADIRIANLEQLAMPAALLIEFENGSRQLINVPVETWMQQRAITLHIPTTLAIKAVTIDPENKLPDNNRANNRLSLLPAKVQ